MHVMATDGGDIPKLVGGVVVGPVLARRFFLTLPWWLFFLVSAALLSLQIDALFSPCLVVYPFLVGGGLESCGGVMWFSGVDGMAKVDVKGGGVASFVQIQAVHWLFCTVCRGLALLVSLCLKEVVDVGEGDFLLALCNSSKFGIWVLMDMVLWLYFLSIPTLFCSYIFGGVLVDSSMTVTTFVASKSFGSLSVDGFCLGFFVANMIFTHVFPIEIETV